ncbi:MAG: RsmE family RNA methyltransferase [Clostridium sp.]|nr:RsmE family RNA methyltransferase [Clostridium sp.]
MKKIVPVLMERTVVKLDEKTANKKIERWQKIAEVAAKQSMRDIIPEIENIIKLQDITKQDYDEVLVAYENEEKNMLKQELKKLQGKDRYKIAIVIGPEGGISEKEIEILKNMGASFVSLGKRILRTETAGIVMSGNIMYELED